MESGDVTLWEADKVAQGLETYKRLKKEDKPDLPEFLPNPFDLMLLSDIPAKKRHYWVWSRQPNMGKTTKFLEPLTEQFRARFYN